MEGPNKRQRRHVDFTVHEYEDSEFDSDAMNEPDSLKKDNQMSLQREPMGSVAKEVVAGTPTEVMDVQTSTFVVGGALKRNPDGSVVAPLVSKKGQKVR